MWPRRSKTIHVPSGEISTDIQVPSLVVKSMSRVLPRAWVTSHVGAGLAGAGVCAGRGAETSRASASEVRIGGHVRVGRAARAEWATAQRWPEHGPTSMAASIQVGEADVEFRRA